MLTVQEMAPAIRSGLPRNGLVALYDPYRDAYGRNVLHVGNADFATGWTAYNSSTITVTPGQPDPDGGNNAYRIQSSGGTATLKYFLGSTPVATGISYRLCLWAKLLSGNATIKDYVTTSITPTSSWGLLSWSALGDGASAPLRIYTAAVGDSLDILVYHPQLNLGSVLYPYSAPSGAPSTLQTMADYHGGLYPLQLGSGGTGDTADPAFTGVGMLHAGDYLISGNLTGVTMAGDWSLPLICKPSGTANTLVSLAASGAADQYQAIEYNGSTKVRIKTANGATVTTSDALTVSATAVQMLSLVSSGNTITLKRMDTGTSVTATNADPTGAARLCIGALGTSTVASAADALTWHLLPLYGRAWTAGEEMRAYVHAKSLMARRGVTLA